MSSPSQTMYETLREMINVELFLLMVEKLNLTPLFQEDDEYTVFIPIDTFFIKIYDKMQPLYDYPLFTQQIVLNHFVKGRHLMEGEMKENLVLQSFQGSNIVINNSHGILKINDGVSFLDMNVVCRNGIIHIVNRMIVPSPDVFNLPPERFLKTSE